MMYAIKNFILDCLDKYLPPLFIITLIFFVLAIPFIIMEENKREKRISELCSKDPSQWECQVYLAEKGKQSITNAAILGGVAGGLIGSAGRR